MGIVLEGWVERDCVKHTGSSGLNWSCLGTLRLCAAHMISRDFLRVSSILQAAKSAAAAASWSNHKRRLARAVDEGRLRIMGRLQVVSERLVYIPQKHTRHQNAPVGIYDSTRPPCRMF